MFTMGGSGMVDLISMYRRYRSTNFFHLKAIEPFFHFRGIERLIQSGGWEPTI